MMLHARSLVSRTTRITSLIILLGSLAMQLPDANAQGTLPKWEKEIYSPAATSLAVSSNGKIYAGNGNGIWYSTNNGNGWTQIETNFKGGADLVMGPAAYTLVAISQDGYINFSPDSGRSWSQNQGALQSQVGVLTKNKITGGILAIGIGKSGTPGGLIRSTDGQNWTMLVNGSGVFSACEDNVENLYYSGDKGPIARSTDNGQTWTNVAPQNYGTYNLSVADNGTIYARTTDIYYSKNYFSMDNGKTWSIFPFPPEGSSSNIATTGNSLYAVGKTGTYSLTAPDTTWRLCAAADSTAGVWQIVTLPDGRLLGAFDDHIYQTNAAPNAVRVQSQPSTIALKQNSPNPFTSSTTIHFELSKPSYASLSIYDITGRCVHNTNGYYTSGSHEEVFDAAHLPSGIYMYRLEAEGKSVIKQMVLEK